MNEKKIIFISHDALRTGAPIIFLNFLRWFRDNANIPFRIMLRNSGELEPEFQTLAPVSVYNRKNNSSGVMEKLSSISSYVQKIRNRTYFNALKKEIFQDNVGLIYSNTVTNGEVLEFLSSLSCPVITHVHELEYWIQRAGLNGFGHVQNYTKHYIAVSQAVKENLVANHGIPEERIDVVYGFIPTQLANLSDNNQVKYRIRAELGIEQEALIVGACGTTDWRKGPDLFIQLARIVCQHGSKIPVHFVWVGGESQGPRFYELWHDIQNSGLSKYVHFIGIRPNSLDYFAAFDVFALVSREDPFPLVGLEAASLGKPLVCFDGAGGMREFVEKDCGFVVPYLDVESMADKTLALLNAAELRQRFGRRAAQKVRERHDIAVGAPKILEIIKRFL